MAQSHPATLLTIARRALKRAVSPNDAIVVAVSGGPDSMAMLSVLAMLAGDCSIRLIAHGVDHGLRTEAQAELDLAERLAERFSVPFTRTCLVVSTGANLQARARMARYEALEEVRATHNARFIATAHHADDRAETVLLRLLRGSSVAGLGVLPLADGHRLRPLIEARKEDVTAHLTRHRIPFATDPSNTNPRYLRSRVRQELLPLLATMNPRIVERLTALADEALLLPKGEPLPRATREALRTMYSSTSPRKMRVSLPGGLVISRDQTNHNESVLSPAPDLRGLIGDPDRAVKSLRAKAVKAQPLVEAVGNQGTVGNRGTVESGGPKFEARGKRETVA